MDAEMFMNTLFNYGAMGICLAYFIFKDVTMNKEFRENCKENTKVVSEFKEVLNVVKDLIKSR